MKSRLLLFTFLLTNMYFYAQNTFTEHLINQPISSPVQVQSADLDGDGDKDFVAISIKGELTWHEQVTNTNWKTHYISMDIKGRSLAISDLDEDSKLDIVVTYSNNGTGEVSWFKNDGNQNFIQTVLSNSNINDNSNKTIVVDIDNDNDNDIISSAAGEIRILRNDGNENFTNESTSINLGGGYLSENTNDIEIIDFDNDGLLDFLVTTRDADGVNWYKQNNDNTFTNNSLLSGTFINIAVGDLDGDNDLDIVTTKDSNTSGTGNEIIVYKNDGNNQNFTLTSVHSVNPALNTGLKHIKLFDADNDNDLDLIYFSGESSNEGLKVRLNNGGVFLNSETDIYLSDFFTGVSGSYGYIEFILEDINLDTKIDIVQVDASSGRINYYQNNDINFATNNFSLIEVTNSSGDVDGISVADIDSDGKLDIVAASKLDYTLEWFGNSGDNLTFSTNKISSTPPNKYIKNLTIDLDGDGDLDIVNTYETSNTSFGFNWFKNNGNLTFTLQNLPNISGSYATNLKYADFDADGDIDILAIRYRGFSLFINDGSENFSVAGIYEPPGLANIYTAEIYDIDNDNLEDIIFLHYTTSNTNRTLGYLKNTGNNTFSSFIAFKDINNNDLVISFNSLNLYDFEISDIDNDGDKDIIGISNSTFGLFSLKNNGSNQYEVNTLVSQSQFGTGRDLKITDIDNDGDKDIIVGGDFGVYWAKNDNNIFTRELIVNNDNSTNSYSFGVELADMDNDGDKDIIYSSNTGNKVAWLENKIDETLSIDLFTTSENDILIYPNPTNGILKINSKEGIKSISFYNIQGKLIFKEKTNSIDLSKFPKGLYLAKIITKNNKSFTKKIIRK